MMQSTERPPEGAAGQTELRLRGSTLSGPGLSRLRRLWRRRSWRVSRRTLGCLVAGAAAALAAGTAVSHMPMRDRVRIEATIRSNFTRAPVLAIGDSITYEAAPGHLCGARVFNAAVPGDRLSDLLAEAPDFAVRLAPERVVIAIGINDSLPPHPDIAQWADDYRTLVALFAGRDLVLVEINPVDPRISSFVTQLDQDFIQRANAVIRDIAAETGAHVVPAPREVITRDGLHPTPAGAALWRARLSEAACSVKVAR